MTKGQLHLALPGETPLARKREVMRRLRKDAERLCDRFGLEPKAILPERDGVFEWYGICSADGVIRIRLLHATTGRILRYSSLVNTLCHELAHLEHMDHKEGFRVLFGRILEHARSEGIYLPEGRSSEEDEPLPEIDDYDFELG
jgi:hypothetical protein